MSASALDGDVHLVRRGHGGTRSVVDGPRGEPGAHVDGKGAGRALTRGGQQALVEHELGAPTAFLAGLEHEHDVAVEVGPTVAQDLGRTRQHRRVQVVAARVHDVVVLAGEVETGVLRHRQRIGVAPQDDRLAVRVASQDRGDATRGLVQVDLERQAIQELENRLAGGRVVDAQFRLPMDGAAEVDDLRLQLARSSE